MSTRVCRYRRSVFTVLFTRRWLAALAAAIVFAVACFYLGRWQWHRHEVKHARADRITAHYGAPAIPVQAVLPGVGSPMTLAREWTRVQLTGRYDAAHQILVRNRPHSSVYGYEVLVPLEIEPSSASSAAPGSAASGSAALLVDRGWVPNGATAVQAPEVPPAPQGTVTVTAWLRLGEPDVHRSPRAGQLSSIDIGQAAQYAGRRLYAPYAILDTERTADGAVPARPTPLEPPDTDEGPHLAYALQWWLGSLTGFALVFMGVRREALDVAAVRAPRYPGPGSPARPGLEPDGMPVLVASRPRRHRIWDDEDE